jgi:hypothetical protein
VLLNVSLGTSHPERANWETFQRAVEKHTLMALVTITASYNIENMSWTRQQKPKDTMDILMEPKRRNMYTCEYYENGGEEERVKLLVGKPEGKRLL